MTYADYIALLRAQVGDVPRYEHVSWTADGQSNVMVMPPDTYPVYDGAEYTVKVGGVLQTEDVDYTLDKTGGTMRFVSTPTVNTTITIDHQRVRQLDSHYLEIINDVVKSLGNDFFKEFVDDSTFTTTSGMLSLSLATDIPKCTAVYEFQYRRTTSEDWQPVAELANWRYDADNKIIYIGIADAFPESGYQLRIRGLKGYDLGTATSDEIDVQDKFLTIIEYGFMARYYRWRYKDVVELVSKMSTEATRTPLQELIMLVDRFERSFEMEKARLKPQKPAKIVPRFLQNGGRP